MGNRGLRRAFAVASIVAIGGIGVTSARANPAATQSPTPDPSSNYIASKPAGQTGADSGFRTDPRQAPLVDSTVRLDAIRAKYPDVAGQSTWDVATQTLTINVVGSVTDTGTPAATFAAELDAASLPVKLAYRPIKVSPAHLAAISEGIAASRAPWATDLPGFSYADADELAGGVVIGVDQNYLSQWVDAAKSAPFDVPVVVRGEPKAGLIYESSRVSDNVPWAGGAYLRSPIISGPDTGGYTRCTGGFNWIRWSGAGVAASTARHCVNSGVGNVSYNWYNDAANTKYLGYPTVTSPSSDTALLQGGGPYSAGVWVGGTTTADYRPVVAAASNDSVGEIVAISGAFSGLKSGQVVAVGQSFDQTTVTLMDSHLAQGGDSGAPWLNTYTNGDVLAIGQHVGATYYAGVLRSAFVQVIRVSAKTQATIATQ